MLECRNSVQHFFVKMNYIKTWPVLHDKYLLFAKSPILLLQTLFLSIWPKLRIVFLIYLEVYNVNKITYSTYELIRSLITLAKLSVLLILGLKGYGHDVVNNYFFPDFNAYHALVWLLIGNQNLSIICRVINE